MQSWLSARSMAWYIFWMHLESKKSIHTTDKEFWKRKIRFAPTLKCRISSHAPESIATISQRMSSLINATKIKASKYVSLKHIAREIVTRESNSRKKSCFIQKFNQCEDRMKEWHQTHEKKKMKIEAKETKEKQAIEVWT